MTVFERVLVNISTLIVGVSGIVHAFMKYLMTSDDPFSAVNHPLQPWMLDVHVIASPALVFAIGLIARDHILGKMGNGANGPGRGTGMFALACLLPMVATGYLIQVFTEEAARTACVVIHLATGALYMVAFLIHLFISRRIAARRRLNASAGRAEEPATAAWMRRHGPARGARSRTRGLR